MDAVNSPRVVTRVMCASSACSWRRDSSVRLRSVMSVTVTSTRLNRAGRGGNVTVTSAVSLSPFRVWREVSAAKDRRPSAMAISPSAKASRVSGTKTLTLCGDTKRSFLLSAANTLTDPNYPDHLLDEFRGRRQLFAKIAHTLRFQLVD